MVGIRGSFGFVNPSPFSSLIFKYMLRSLASKKRYAWTPRMIAPGNSFFAESFMFWTTYSLQPFADTQGVRSFSPVSADLSVTLRRP